MTGSWFQPNWATPSHASRVCLTMSCYIMPFIYDAYVLGLFSMTRYRNNSNPYVNPILCQPVPPHLMTTHIRVLVNHLHVRWIRRIRICHYMSRIRTPLHGFHNSISGTISNFMTGGWQCVLTFLAPLVFVDPIFHTLIFCDWFADWSFCCIWWLIM